MPADWKFANVSPIHKKGSRAMANNYRPVSLTCLASKIMESIIRDAILLNVPMTRSVTYGDRAFCSIGPTWWNSLPSELKTSPSVDSFKRNLKTHLFKLAYGQ